MIYLDYQATTPLAPEARGGDAAVARGRLRQPAQRRIASAARRRRRSRLRASRSPRCSPAGGRLLFTSGATEAANWALKGSFADAPAERRRIVTLATEHACVLDSVAWLGGQGAEVDRAAGRAATAWSISTPRARRSARRPALVAAMLVNNEIGVIQPIAEIGALAHAAGALFLCDAVQGYGRVAVPLDACDLVALSAHKIHGPKGIGALWVRDGVALDPLLHGGGQEGGLRSGTLVAGALRRLRRGGAAARRARGRGSRAMSSGCGRALARRARRRWMLNGSAEHRYPRQSQPPPRRARCRRG